MSASTQAIKLAAFDLGNVMVDVQESIPIRRLAEISGQPESKVFDVVFSPARKAEFESGKITWEQHAATAMEQLKLPVSEPELREIYRTSLIPDHEVIGMVAAVAETIRITIASNTSQPHWEWVQEHLPFAELFDPPILSHLVGVMKPDAGFYRPLIERSGLAPEDIFFTDDRTENVEGAAVLGIRSFLFVGPDQLRADLRSCGVTV